MTVLAAERVQGRSRKARLTVVEVGLMVEVGNVVGCTN